MDMEHAVEQFVNATSTCWPRLKQQNSIMNIHLGILILKNVQNRKIQ